MNNTAIPSTALPEVCVAQTVLVTKDQFRTEKLCIGQEDTWTGVGHTAFCQALCNIPYFPHDGRPALRKGSPSSHCIQSRLPLTSEAHLAPGPQGAAMLRGGSRSSQIPKQNWRKPSASLLFRLEGIRLLLFLTTRSSKRAGGKLGAWG